MYGIFSVLPHLSFYGYRVIREINDIHTHLAMMLNNTWRYLRQLQKLAIHGAFMIMLSILENGRAFQPA